MPDDEPDFADPSPMAISMRVLLHLEKVQNGEEIWTNMCEAYRLIFGAEPALDRSAEDISNEIQAALSAMAPAYEAPPPLPPHMSAKRGPVANSAGLTGHSTVPPVPPRLMQPGVIDTTHPPKQKRKRRKVTMPWWAFFIAYILGASQTADNWGEMGFAILWMTGFVFALQLVDRHFARRDARKSTNKEST